MRKALNDNPVVQVAVLAALVVLVGFLLLTRVMSKSDGSDSAPTPTSTSAGATATPAPTDGSTTQATPDASTGTIPPSAASTTSVTPDTTEAPPSVGSASVAPSVSSKLTAGPGLPQSVARAYADDKAIVLLIFRRKGIDDTAVHASVERLRGRNDLAVFAAHAGHIARYSRITEGVDVNRVPALIVVRPRRLADGTPTATVSYGFRGPDSVEQAVRDALYKGPTNLPYYPK